MTHASGNGAGRASQSAQTDPGTAGDRGVFARVLIDASIVHIWLRRIESVACDASQTPAAEKRGELAIGPIRVIDPTTGNRLTGVGLYTARALWDP